MDENLNLKMEIEYDWNYGNLGIGGIWRKAHSIAQHSIGLHLRVWFSIESINHMGDRLSHNTYTSVA